MDKQKIIIIILVLALISVGCYIVLEKVEFCEAAKNDSYNAGFNNGNEEGFNQGYFNGSRDYVILLNQQQKFPCLNFQTGEYSEKSIGVLCQNGE